MGQITKSDFYELLQHRKSIRQFKTDEVSNDVLERIIYQAALHAPSGKNRQNWRFFVVQGQKKMTT